MKKQTCTRASHRSLDPSLAKLTRLTLPRNKAIQRELWHKVRLGIKHRLSVQSSSVPPLLDIIAASLRPIRPTPLLLQITHTRVAPLPRQGASLSALPQDQTCFGRRRVPDDVPDEDALLAWGKLDCLLHDSEGRDRLGDRNDRRDERVVVVVEPELRRST